MGGKGKESKKLTQEQVFTLYQAGPEAIFSLVEYLQNNIQNLQNNIQQLHERLQEIERQLKMNSRNSNKPPSSDGMKKIPKVRKPTGRKPGGQKGHEGKTLKMVAKPDKVKVHKVECCGSCSNSLKDKQATAAILGELRQEEPKIEKNIKTKRNQTLDANKVSLE